MGPSFDTLLADKKLLSRHRPPAPYWREPILLDRTIQAQHLQLHVDWEVRLYSPKKGGKFSSHWNCIDMLIFMRYWRAWERDVVPSPADTCLNSVIQKPPLSRHWFNASLSLYSFAYQCQSCSKSQKTWSRLWPTRNPVHLRLWGLSFLY